MLLGGLWHGAAWNFVLWGGYQGAHAVSATGALDRREWKVGANAKIETRPPRASPPTPAGPSPPRRSLDRRRRLRRDAAEDAAAARQRQVAQPRRVAADVLWHIGSVLLFLVFCCYGWMLFRANGIVGNSAPSSSRSLSQIGAFTKAFAGFGPHHAASHPAQGADAGRHRRPARAGAATGAPSIAMNDAAFHQPAGRADQGGRHRGPARRAHHGIEQCHLLSSFTSSSEHMTIAMSRKHQSPPPASAGLERAVRARGAAVVLAWTVAFLVLGRRRR